MLDVVSSPAQPSPPSAPALRTHLTQPQPRLHLFPFLIFIPHSSYSSSSFQGTSLSLSTSLSFPLFFLSLLILVLPFLLLNLFLRFLFSLLPGAYISARKRIKERFDSTKFSEGFAPAAFLAPWNAAASKQDPSTRSLCSSPPPDQPHSLSSPLLRPAWQHPPSIHPALQPHQQNCKVMCVNPCPPLTTKLYTRFFCEPLSSSNNIPPFFV